MRLRDQDASFLRRLFVRQRRSQERGGIIDAELKVVGFARMNIRWRNVLLYKDQS